MVQLAKETGLTCEGLYKALSKDGNSTLGTVLKVLKALGLKFTPTGRLREIPGSTINYLSWTADSDLVRFRMTPRSPHQIANFRFGEVLVSAKTACRHVTFGT